MKRILFLLGIVMLLAMPVQAEEFTAPPPPEDAEALMPVESKSFFEDVMSIIRQAAEDLMPELTNALRVCAALVAIAVAVSLLQTVSGNLPALELAAVVGISVLLVKTSGAMITLGAETVRKLSDYGKLLLPVMTGALAAQGGAASSAALYTLTVIFDSLLSSVASAVIVPMVYAFLALSIAGSAMGQGVLGKLADLIKWAATWFLKIILYGFTGFMSVTGIVSGTADAAAVKAAKLTISGMVPVVGGILSDASESVIVGAGVVKNAVGIYGLLAVIAIWITPFIQLGVQYLLLKGTAALTEVFGFKCGTELIGKFAAAMGLLVALTGTVCFLLLISTVCIMKGGA